MDTTSTPRPLPQTPPPPRSVFQSCLPGCLVSLLVLFICLIGGCFSIVYLTKAAMENSDKLMAPFQGDPEKTYVKCISLNGVISLESKSWQTKADSATGALEAIESVIDEPAVKAILLEVNSGGGGITDSDIIYQALNRFKAKSAERKVVTLFKDTAASGGYYIAMPSDAIIAHPTTITGSIGVIMQSFNLQELIKKLGIAPVTFKSGDNKDILSPFSETTPAQREMLQNMIDSLQNRFVSLVAEGRNLPEAKVRTLADGRIYLADEALKHGLIDAIGYREDAEAKVKDLLNDKNAVFLRQSRSNNFFFYQIFESGINLNVTLPGITPEAQSENKLRYEHTW